MYLYEMLNEFTDVEITNEICKLPYFFDMIDLDNTIDEIEKNRRKDVLVSKYQKAVSEIKDFKESEIEVNDGKLLLFLPRIGENNGIYDCNLLYIKEEKQKIIDAISIKQFEDVLNFKNPCYCIDFEPTNVILGYSVCNDNIKRIGKLKCVATVINSILNFGLTEDERISVYESIISALTNQIHDIKSKKEKTYTIDELYKQLGFKREKLKQKKKIIKAQSRYIERCESIKNILEYIFEIQLSLYSLKIVDDNIIS